MSPIVNKVIGPEIPILGEHKFNARVDAESIMATLARQNGQTLHASGGVSFVPYNGAILRQAIGEVRLPSGVIIGADVFFKLSAWQDDYARRCVKFLNGDLGHDGAWAVMWLNPTIDGLPTEIRFAWQDDDGDVQFVVESDVTLVKLQQTDDPRTMHGNNAEAAYRQYRDFLQDVDVQENQKIKAAQGQRPRDPNDQPII